MEIVCPKELRVLKFMTDFNMKKTIFIIIAAVIMTVAAGAQSHLKKVYDESLNQLEQISEAVKKAEANDHFVICQVGGNWCRWCLMFAEFITSDEEISTLISNNFEYIHVNYNPRNPKDAVAAKALETLGNPERFGFPVLVVLDDNGNVIHTQDSSFLEEGNGYNKAKVLRFFNSWKPDAVRK